MNANSPSFFWTANELEQPTLPPPNSISPTPSPNRKKELSEKQ